MQDFLTHLEQLVHTRQEALTDMKNPRATVYMDIEGLAAHVAATNMLAQCVGDLETLLKMVKGEEVDIIEPEPEIIVNDGAIDALFAVSNLQHPETPDSRT